MIAYRDEDHIKELVVMHGNSNQRKERGNYMMNISQTKRWETIESDQWSQRRYDQITSSLEPYWSVQLGQNLKRAIIFGFHSQLYRLTKPLQ